MQKTRWTEIKKLSAANKKSTNRQTAHLSKKAPTTKPLKLGSDESFYNLMIYEVFTDLSAAIKRDLQRYRRP